MVYISLNCNMKRVLMSFGVILPLFVMAQSDSTTNKEPDAKTSQSEEYAYLIKANDNLDKGDLKSAAMNIEKADDRL